MAAGFVYKVRAMNQMHKLDATPPSQVQIVQAAEQDDGDVIDLRGLISTVWRGKWIIAICAFIAAVLAVLAVSQFEPKYKASAKVMFDIQKANVVDLQQVLVDQEFTRDTLQNEIEVLRSTNLIERVIGELKLDRNPDQPLARDICITARNHRSDDDPRAQITTSSAARSRRSLAA